MKHSIYITILGLLLSIIPLSSIAQSSVTGTVTDQSTGEPLPGVNVIIKNTTKGAATNSQGFYKITDLEAGSYNILVRFLGYKQKSKQVTVNPNETATLDFSLLPGSVNLDEVVVTGTGGPVEKRKVGNTISSVGAEELNSAPIQNFSDVIQGRIPGLNAMPSSGVTGEGARIRVRGSSSLSQSNEPIVFIDGIRVDRGGGFGGAVSAGGGGSPSRLDDINPQSIARVEVLKGAAAATLYGTEASNGVIQIFTKRGQVSKPKFDFQVTQGTINYPKTFPANTGFARTSSQADTMSKYLERDVERYELVSENYIHKLFETGISQEYSGSVSGGTEGITYYVNGRWSGENGPLSGERFRYPKGFGPLANDQLSRAQTSANFNIFPTDNLQLRVNSAYSSTSLETFQTGNNVSGVTSGAIHSKPELVSQHNTAGASYNSTVQERLQQTVSQDVRHFNGSLGTNYRPHSNLVLDGTFGVDYTSQFSESRRPYGWNINNYATEEEEGARRTSARSHLNLTLDIKATLSNDIGQRYTSTLIGGIQGFKEETVIRSGEGVRFPGPGLDVTGAAAEQSAQERYTEETEVGFFLQEQLGFDDFIFTTVGGRFDTHSAFGSKFSGVFYPKASISVVFSDAPFWSSVEPISSLRFRSAVGQSGLQPGAFDALTTYSSRTSANGPGIVPENLGNADLKPEISTEYEIGIDVGLFNERLTLESTYWDRTVRDALVQRQFVPSGGFLQTQLVNIGELKGRGVELSLDAQVLETSDWSAQLFASSSYLWEQITSLGGAPPLKVGGTYPRYRQFLKEGYAPATNFGAKLLETPKGFYPLDRRGLLKALGHEYSSVQAGLPASKALVLEYLASLNPQTATLEGLNNHVLMADYDGDGDHLDHHLGKPTPDWKGSFGGSVSFKNFRLSTLFEYKAGNFYVNNLTDAFRQRSAGIGRNTPDAARVERNYITGGIDENNTPQNNADVRLGAAEEWMNKLLALDPFAGLNTIQSADFLRLRELSLSYKVPQSTLDRLGVRNLSFSLSGRNLWLWSKYPGVDPEVNAIGRGGGSDLENNFLLGTDAWNMPIPRRITFTLNVGI